MTSDAASQRSFAAPDALVDTWPLLDLLRSLAAFAVLLGHGRYWFFAGITETPNPSAFLSCRYAALNGGVDLSHSRVAGLCMQVNCRQPRTVVARLRVDAIFSCTDRLRHNTSRSEQCISLVFFVPFFANAGRDCSEQA